MKSNQPSLHETQYGSPLPRFVPRLTQDRLEHIVERHWFTSGISGVGHFGADVGLKELRQLIEEATTSGAGWVVQGGFSKLEADLGRLIGTDLTGTATTWIRIVINQAGEIVTAYPIPHP